MRKKSSLLQYGESLFFRAAKYPFALRRYKQAKTTNIFKKCIKFSRNFKFLSQNPQNQIYANGVALTETQA